MSVQVQKHNHLYDQLMPFIIVLSGLLVGVYLYFYLTTVEASVQQSLGSNTSPQSALVGVSPNDEAEITEKVLVNQNLQDKLEKLVGKQSATMAVYVQPLDGSPGASVNASTTFKAASLYKLFVAYETLLRVDENKLSLSQPTGFDAGSKSIGDCLEIMITVSDNPCGRALRKVLDITEKPLPRLADLGFIGTNLAYDYPTTSAQDLALLFEKLYTQEDLSEKSNQLFLTHLKNQQINDRIPKGLPNNSEVAHKTGDLEGFAHDAGIVYDRSGDYVIVLLGGPWSADLYTVYSQYVDITSLVHQQLTGVD